MITLSLWPNVLLLVSVVAPLAMAEFSATYFLASVLGGAVALLVSRRARPWLIGPRLAQVVIVLAFAYLIFEYVYLDRILVMSLAHFLVTVCIVRLLQPRSPREEAQIVVLCLMLLVVAAIISGNVLFVIALFVTVTVGVSRLMRLHLLAEANGTAVARHAGQGRLGPKPLALPLRWIIAGVSLGGLAAGTLVFLASPRMESGFLRDLHDVRAGPVLTGFGSSVDLSGGQTISPSERPVIRVRLGGPVSLSIEEHETHHYFRGRVSLRYGRRPGGLGGGWGWLRSTPEAEEVRTVQLDAETSRAVLGYSGLPQNTIEYQFWLEPGDYSNLFTPSPILAVSSHDFDEIKFNVRDHLLRVDKRGKLIRYSVTTVPPYAAPLVKHRLETESTTDPPVLLPDIRLPREAEIVELLNANIGDVGPLSLPENREAFAGKLERFLSSPPYIYSLTTPPVGRGREPISEFLLTTKRGHCEYFASAMVVACQLYGIPARLVTGYRGGDYNPVGGFLIVREKHAHAWVEVFIPGKGWLTYDPTPSASRVTAQSGEWWAPARTFTDFLQFQWANLVIAYDAAARRDLMSRFHAWVTRPTQDETNLLGAVAAFVRELFGWRLEISTADRVLYWVFALLVVTLILLLGYVVLLIGRQATVVARRWHAAVQRARAGRPTVEFYERFCRRLETLGFRRRPDQTPAEFADELASRYSALRDAPELVRLYYGLAFGAVALPPERHSWVEQFLAELGRLDRLALAESPS